MCVILMLYGKEIIFSNLQMEERKIMAEGAGGYMEEINQRKIMVGCYYCAACGPHFACSERQVVGRSFGFRRLAEGFKLCGSWEQGRMLSDSLVFCRCTG